MSEDQHDDDGGKSYESTLEVDKAELMAEISNDRSKSAAQNRESSTARMPAVEEDTAVQRNPLYEAQDHDVNDGSTIPMPAVDVDSDEDLATTNFAVPEELLQQISQPAIEDDNRWETMEIVIEELEDSEFSEVESDDDGGPSFVLEKISDPAGQTFEGELSSKQTSPVLYRMEFEARVNQDGTISIPQKYLESGHVRPGMRFKIEAIGLREDE